MNNFKTKSCLLTLLRALTNMRSFLRSESCRGRSSSYELTQLCMVAHIIQCSLVGSVQIQACHPDLVRSRACHPDLVRSRACHLDLVRSRACHPDLFRFRPVIRICSDSGLLSGSVQIQACYLDLFRSRPVIRIRLYKVLIFQKQLPKIGKYI